VKRIRWSGALPLLLIVIAAAALNATPPAYAAAIVVNTTADEVNADGDCSLREALEAANQDAAPTRSPCRPARSRLRASTTRPPSTTT
jgi:CSLREA domain-containing protein